MYIIAHPAFTFAELSLLLPLVFFGIMVGAFSFVVLSRLSDLLRYIIERISVGRPPSFAPRDGEGILVE